MLCPVCHGRHFVVVAGVTRPCPECGGVGEIHCCEGLQAQPSHAESACRIVAKEAAPATRQPASAAVSAPVQRKAS